MTSPAYVGKCENCLRVVRILWTAKDRRRLCADCLLRIDGTDRTGGLVGLNEQRKQAAAQAAYDAAMGGWATAQTTEDQDAVREAVWNARERLIELGAYKPRGMGTSKAATGRITEEQTA